MDQHRFHAKRVGDEAGMLAAGTAKAVEQILGDIVASLHGDLLDGVGHVLDGDGDEALGDGLGCSAIADLGFAATASSAMPCAASSAMTAFLKVAMRLPISVLDSSARGFSSACWREANTDDRSMP